MQIDSGLPPHSNGPLEVGWHKDPEMQEIWANTFKQARQPVIGLLSGSGRWGIGLTKGASIRNLYAQLPAFIALLGAHGETRFSAQSQWPRGVLGDGARDFGIAYARCLSSTGDDFAVFIMPPQWRIISQDPNIIVAWLDEVLSSSDHQDTTARLLPIDANERHVFLMTGGRTTFGVDDRLREVHR